MTNESGISLNMVVSITANLLTTQVGTETVILNLENSTYFGLDPVGTFIWAQIQQPSRLVDVKTKMLQKYKVEAARCEADLLNFVRQLSESGLIALQAIDAE